VKEFLGSGTSVFTVPPNITALMVEMWGAGGAGGRTTYCPTSGPSAYGGAGGGGAYTRTVFPVTPGEVLAIVVGTGGVSGVNGGDAGASAVLRGNTIVTFAGGGHGGTPDSATSKGTGGAAGSADPNAAISHPGYPGGYPSAPGYPYAYNLAPISVFGNNPTVGIGIGDGGGACDSSISYGAPGYVLLTW